MFRVKNINYIKFYRQPSLVKYGQAAWSIRNSSSLATTLASLDADLRDRIAPDKWRHHLKHMQFKAKAFAKLDGLLTSSRKEAYRLKYVHKPYVKRLSDHRRSFGLYSEACLMVPIFLNKISHETDDAIRQSYESALRLFSRQLMYTVLKHAGERRLLVYVLVYTTLKLAEPPDTKKPLCDLFEARMRTRKFTMDWDFNEAVYEDYNRNVLQRLANDGHYYAILYLVKKRVGEDFRRANNQEINALLKAAVLQYQFIPRMDDVKRLLALIDESGGNFRVHEDTWVALVKFYARENWELAIDILRSYQRTVPTLGVRQLYEACEYVLIRTVSTGNKDVYARMENVLIDLLSPAACFHLLAAHWPEWQAVRRAAERAMGVVDPDATGGEAHRRKVVSSAICCMHRLQLPSTVMCKWLRQCVDRFGYESLHLEKSNFVFDSVHALNHVTSATRLAELETCLAEVHVSARGRLQLLLGSSFMHGLVNAPAHAFTLYFTQVAEMREHKHFVHDVLDQWCEALLHETDTWILGRRVDTERIGGIVSSTEWHEMGLVVARTRVANTLFRHLRVQSGRAVKHETRELRAWTECDFGLLLSSLLPELPSRVKSRAYLSYLVRSYAQGVFEVDRWGCVKCGTVNPTWSLERCAKCHTARGETDTALQRHALTILCAMASLDDDRVAPIRRALLDLQIDFDSDEHKDAHTRDLVHGTIDPELDDTGSYAHAARVAARLASQLRTQHDGGVSNQNENEEATHCVQHEFARRAQTHVYSPRVISVSNVLDNVQPGRQLKSAKRVLSKLKRERDRLVCLGNTGEELFLQSLEDLAWVLRRVEPVYLTFYYQIMAMDWRFSLCKSMTSKLSDEESAHTDIEKSVPAFLNANEREAWTHRLDVVYSTLQAIFLPYEGKREERERFQNEVRR